MESRHFDNWSRAYAQRQNRRGVLRAGGLAAMALGLFGIRSSRAQNEEPTGLGTDGICRLRFEATVQHGPSASLELAGLLEIEPDEGGGIEQGALILEDGSIHDVVGQASGRSLALRIGFGDGTFIAVGAGENTVRSCSGKYGGPAVGPIRGDLSEWTAFTDEASPAATANATAPVPTSTPGPCDNSTCDERMDRSVDAQGNCKCNCPADAVPCGTSCCYGGGACADPATGACACSEPNDVLCGDTCINRYDCPYNTQFNETTCECTPECYYPGFSGVCCNGSCIDFNTNPEHCGGCGDACPAGEACINGVCGCPDMCNGVCVDLGSNSSNCGVCGNVCGYEQRCLSGICTCIDDRTACGMQCVDLNTSSMNCGECGYQCSVVGYCDGGVCVCNAGFTDCGGTCVDLLSNSVTCGSCTNSCAPDRICVNGVCQCVLNRSDCGGVCTDLMYDKNNCGACGNVCPDLGPNSGCIFGICV